MVTVTIKFGKKYATMTTVYDFPDANTTQKTRITKEEGLKILRERSKGFIIPDQVEGCEFTLF